MLLRLLTRAGRRRPEDPHGAAPSIRNLLAEGSGEMDDLHEPFRRILRWRLVRSLGLQARHFEEDEHDRRPDSQSN
jgi:hypothetical protein